MVGTNWGGVGSTLFAVGVEIGGILDGGLGGVGVAERGERRGRLGLTPPGRGDGRRGEMIGRGSKGPPLISRSGGGLEEKVAPLTLSFTSLSGGLADSDTRELPGSIISVEGEAVEVFVLEPSSTPATCIDESSAEMRRESVAELEFSNGFGPPPPLITPPPPAVAGSGTPRV